MKKVSCSKCGSADMVKQTRRKLADGSFKQRYKCKNPACGVTTSFPGEGGKKVEGQIIPSREIPRVKTYIITAAQNATPVKREFWESLMHCKRYYNAELFVLALRYKNPTSIWTQQQESQEWWWGYLNRSIPGSQTPDLTPYLVQQRFDLCRYMTVLGDVKTQLTQQIPLTGFESITMDKSGILGHPRLELKTVATPQHKIPKLMYTTGVCTEQNYTDTSLGKRGHFHHTFGALLVQVQGEHFYVRHLNAMRDGSFIDLGKEFTPEGVRSAGRAEAVILGDVHCKFIDPAAERATFGAGGMVEALDPKLIVWHDLLDEYARNPHDRHNPFIQYGKAKFKLDDVKAEAREAYEYVVKMGRGRKNLIVPSNHDNMLYRWAQRADWRQESPANAEFLLETSLAILQEMKKHPAEGVWIPDPFVYWCRKWMTEEHPEMLSDTIFGEPDVSFTVKDIELIYHGHEGPNGARGTTRNLSRLGVKVFKGHDHLPGIREGCYSAGTLSYLRRGWNRGPSGWMHANGAIYSNGKRAILTITEGRWRVEE